VLGSTRRVIVASPDYLRRHGRPRKPGDLQAHALVSISALTGSGWRLGKGRSMVSIRSEPALTTNSADAAIEHVLQGGGLAMVLGYQVQSLIEAGKLETVLTRYEPEPIPIQVVYPAARHPSITVRAFVDLAVTNARWNFMKLEHQKSGVGSRPVRTSA
jgi:DNA-binding transcriptional LysR family regulator